MRPSLTVGLVLDDGADAPRIADVLGRKVDRNLGGGDLLFRVLGREGEADVGAVAPAFYRRV